MCTFVTPIYIQEKNVETLEFFKQNMESIFEQTSQDWSMVLVDDNSQNKLLDDYINNIIQKQKQTIVYHHNDSNMGPGIARNVGVGIAYDLGSDIILYQDCDDLAHPKRVEVTREIFKTKNVDLLYSHFIPIDEHGSEIEINCLSNSIKSVLENSSNNPPVGKEIWKYLLTDALYINLTSSTSVRIEYAKKIPFPKGFSEDTYTWMLYSAYGAVFDYIKEIPAKYRIPRNVKVNSSREYIGEKFHCELVEVLTKAFNDCSECAMGRGATTEEELKELKSTFYVNLYFYLKKEGAHDLAKKINKKYKELNFLLNNNV